MASTGVRFPLNACSANNQSDEEISGLLLWLLISGDFSELVYTVWKENCFDSIESRAGTSVKTKILKTENDN
jgi:hypothetical protein